ncbi:MAG: hypothetical protein CVU81_02130 [Euryarchaeota archaeon HGW-Euryarchaeota-1]|nr:MAG: hypothetical protein CVU81_02130 [Euryarchaeota archaeon HGW-Euryarchaeota-1]
MERIILFRFHKNPEVCRNRLHMLQKYNPDIKLFGLYGGLKKNFPKFKKELGCFFEHIWLIPKDKDWNWKHGDLAIREWFKYFGYKIKFDTLHLIEWDLLLFDSLSNIYKQIPKEGVGLTGLTPLKNVEPIWYWTSKDPYKTEWKALLKFVKNKFNYTLEPFGCLCGGLCLPRKFIEIYAKTNIPELCHDELRLPLFAQIFGFKMYDTGFYKKWFY